MPTTHLLYLHGFRSSPQSMKARKVAARVQAQHPGVTWWCPQLPPSPREAMNLIMRDIADWPRDAMAVVGSSLGGFYATWMAQQTGCPAVPLNPAVDPARDLAKYIGEQTSWHIPDDRFFFQAGVHRGARPERCRSHDPGQQHLRPVAGRIWRARHLPQPGEPGTRREGVFPTGVGMNRPL
ncbi:MAG: YqiA/YcfP family alpha/beta fold hydrolase [Polaromonas sp.]